MINKKYVTVSSKSDVIEMSNHIKNGDIIAFDTETNSLNPRKGKIIGFSVSADIGVGFYLPTMIFKDGNLIDNFIYINRKQKGRPLAAHKIRLKLIWKLEII